MNDKKSCENCKDVNAGFLCHDRASNPHLTGWRRANVCDYWQRDPHLWFSIPPSEPGWYWLKLDSGRAIVKWIDKLNIGHIASGQIWQGPITPKG